MSELAAENRTSAWAWLLDKSRRPFLLRKLHSLTGVVPVGVFLLFHLWTNAKALKGRETFDAAVADIGHMPYLPVIEIGGILLPLAFHALYGVKLSLEAKHNVGRYAYSRNWMYTLQRVTGVLALAFIAFHLSEYWLPKMTGRMTADQFYPTLCANLSSKWNGVPVVALVYMLGIAASVFHFANGLWGFCFSWGITISRRAQRLSATVFGLVGLVLLFLGANTVVYFATGSRLFGASNATTPDGRPVQTCATAVAAGPGLGGAPSFEEGALAERHGAPGAVAR